MAELALLKTKVQEQLPTGTAPSLNWKDSSSVQRLLDIICSILAEEYIMIAKQNPKMFIEIASGASCSCNDERKK